MAPLGYDTKDRKITVNEAEAERVRTIFRSYLKLGSLNPLMADLRKRGIITKLRTLKTGESVGGIPFTRGPLGYLLRNRFYIGEVVIQGRGSDGRATGHRRPRAVRCRPGQTGGAEQQSQDNQDEVRGVAGRTHLRRPRQPHEPEPCPQARHQVPVLSVIRPARWAARESRIGIRVPAVEIETLVVKAVREHLKLEEPDDDGGIVKAHVVRVEVQAGPTRRCSLPRHRSSKRGRPSRGQLPSCSWHKTSSVRRREILLPDNGSSQTQNARPIRSETRATLVASIARGRTWLDEIIADPKATTESIAKRERCSPRKINKTISLAFLAPDLVKAAIEGRLPHGMGVARLFDLPAEWSRQRQMLGLAAR